MKILTKIVLPLIAMSTFSSFAFGNGLFAERKYNAINGPELYVERTHNGDSVLGVGVYQKENAQNFCRKTTVVYPNATPDYTCYTIAVTGEEARQTYEAGAGPEFDVTFFIGNFPRVGQGWTEKQAKDLSIGDDLLCVRTHPVIPNATSTYRCYTTETSVGGAISVGN